MDQTRKQFLRSIGMALATRAGFPALLGAAQSPGPVSSSGRQKAKDDPPAVVPSYLSGFEARYRKDPRGAAVEWHRNAKWGLFVHYALYSLRGVTARDALKTKEGSSADWKKLKQGTPAEYAKLKERFT